jgi:hypothetical protein
VTRSRWLQRSAEAVGEDADVPKKCPQRRDALLLVTRRLVIAGTSCARSALLIQDHLLAKEVLRRLSDTLICSDFREAARSVG